jgi:hypothetical protein
MSDENLDHGPALDARDADETRRLLYGALAAGRTKRWELVGTLANALVHHSNLATNPYELVDYLVEVVESDLVVTADAPVANRVRGYIAALQTT